MDNSNTTADSFNTVDSFNSTIDIDLQAAVNTSVLNASVSGNGISIAQTYSQGDMAYTDGKGADNYSSTNTMTGSNYDNSISGSAFSGATGITSVAQAAGNANSIQFSTPVQSNMTFTK